MIKLQLFGDFSFNGIYNDPNYKHIINDNFEKLNNDLPLSDFRIINWESPITYEAVKASKNKNTICTNPVNLESLNFLGIDIANIGNNHIGDFGSEGYFQTKKIFDELGIETFGASDIEFQNFPLKLKKNGYKIALLSYTGADSCPLEFDVSKVYLEPINIDKIVSDIHLLDDEYDITIVSLHWGIEFLRLPSVNQRMIARRLVEAGANIVYGHHSHVVQGYEHYNNGIIFYGLGNFMFGGLMGRESNNWIKESRKIFIPTISINKNTIEVKCNYYLEKDKKIFINNKFFRNFEQKIKNKVLSLPDYIYSFLYKAEKIYQWIIISPFRFIITSGGLIKSIKRLKLIHLKSLLHNLFK